MTTLPYRSVVTGVPLERPLQEFSASLQAAMDWANAMRERHGKGAAVKIFETREAQVAEVRG